jgi:hypothetical protein
MLASSLTLIVLETYSRVASDFELSDEEACLGEVDSALEDNQSQYRRPKIEISSTTAFISIITER